MKPPHRVLCTLLASVILATLCLAAAPITSSQGISVGEFVTLLAAYYHPATVKQPVSTPDAAVCILSKAGVQVKGDLAFPMTRGDAIDIFRQLGIALMSPSPETLLDKERASVLVETFGDTLAARLNASSTRLASAGDSTFAFGARFLETPVEDCQRLPKTKECHDCVLALGFPKRVVGRICSLEPHVSSPEPAP